MDNWLQGVAAVNVRESSLSQYQKMTKYHVTPLIGDIDIQDLTPAILDRWMRQLTRKGLAQKSLKLILAILRQALNYAVYPSNLIQSNPALHIKVPRTAPRDLVKRKIITPRNLPCLWRSSRMAMSCTSLSCCFTIPGCVLPKWPALDGRILT